MLKHPLPLKKYWACHNALLQAIGIASDFFLSSDPSNYRFFAEPPYEVPEWVYPSAEVSFESEKEVAFFISNSIFFGRNQQGKPLIDCLLEEKADLSEENLLWLKAAANARGGIYAILDVDPDTITAHALDLLSDEEIEFHDEGLCANGEKAKGIAIAGNLVAASGATLIHAPILLGKVDADLLRLIAFLRRNKVEMGLVMAICFHHRKGKLIVGEQQPNEVRYFRFPNKK